MRISVNYNIWYTILCGATLISCLPEWDEDHIWKCINSSDCMLSEGFECYENLCTLMCGDIPCNKSMQHTPPVTPTPGISRPCGWNNDCTGDNSLCVSETCFLDTDIENALVKINHPSPLADCGEEHCCRFTTNYIATCSQYTLYMYNNYYVPNGLCTEMCNGRPCDRPVNPGWDQPYDTYRTDCL